MIYRKKFFIRPVKGVRVDEPLHRSTVLLLNASMDGAIKSPIV